MFTWIFLFQKLIWEYAKGDQLSLYKDLMHWVAQIPLFHFLSP